MSGSRSQRLECFPLQGPESDGSYTIVHSAHAYLMDRRNRLAGTLNFQQPEDEQVEKLRQLIAAK